MRKTLVVFLSLQLMMSNPLPTDQSPPMEEVVVAQPVHVIIRDMIRLAEISRSTSSTSQVRMSHVYCIIKGCGVRIIMAISFVFTITTK